MAQQFSNETQRLLDRAQRAIDDSVKLREMRALHLARTMRYSLELEDQLSFPILPASGEPKARIPKSEPRKTVW